MKKLYNHKCSTSRFQFYQHLLWKLRQNLELKKFINLFNSYTKIDIYHAIADVSSSLEETKDQICDLFKLIVKLLLHIGQIQLRLMNKVRAMNKEQVSEEDIFDHKLRVASFKRTHEQWLDRRIDAYCE